MSDTDFFIHGVHVSPSRNLMVFEGETLSIEPRIMEVLHYLAKHAPEVVSRDTLIGDIWKVEHGSDESLTRAVSILRRSFKNLGCAEPVIETISKRGYRLVPLPTPATPETKPNHPVSYVENRKSKELEHLTPQSRTHYLAPFVKSITIGGLIAFGGVFGISQFFPKNNPTKVSPELYLNTLQAEGQITGEQAEKLKDMLASNETMFGEGTLSKALETKDKDRVVALAKMVNASSFMEGFDQLEAMAETFEDWKLLAELSLTRDTNRSLKASKQALLKDPTNMSVLVMHSQALALSGRHLEAQKAAESLRLIATSKLEKLLAEHAVMTNHMIALDNAAIDRDYDNYVHAAKQYSEIADLTPPAEPIKYKDIDDLPIYMMASSSAMIAQADMRLERWERALVTLELENQHIRRTLQHVRAKDHLSILLSLITNHRHFAFCYENLEDFERAYAYQAENLRVLDEVDALGGPGADVYRPNTWVFMAKLAIKQGASDKAIQDYTRAIEGYEHILEKQPDHSKAFKGLKRTKSALESYKATLSE